MRIVFTGGGSGGHVVPNVAIIKNILSQAPETDILYIGSINGPEKHIIEAIHTPYHAITTGKLRRYFSLTTFIDGIKFFVGILQSLFILHRYAPDIIFSKGGYVSLPVTIAAWILRIPIIIHESDIHPGLANRIAARFANTVCVASNETRKYFPNAHTIVTGIPLRLNLHRGDAEQARSVTKLHEDIPTLLFIGGGNGDSLINTLVHSAIPELTKCFQIIHLLGSGSTSSDAPSHRYTPLRFVDEMKNLYTLADVVTSRAGATTLAELAYLGKRAIIIPMTKGCSRGEQIENANMFAQTHEATVLQESECTVSALYSAITSIQNQTAPIAEPNTATQTITTLLLSYDHIAS